MDLRKIGFAVETGLNCSKTWLTMCMCGVEILASAIR
jgi:hypothetical protein